jgi:bacteriorhodopsin
MPTWNWFSQHGVYAALVALIYVTWAPGMLSARRLQDARNEVEMAIMKEASDTSVIFSAVFFFLLGALLVSDAMPSDLQLVQRSTLKKRIEFSLAVCVYICFFSCLFNVCQYGEDDDFVLQGVDSRDVPVLDVARPIEWILTCPLQQLLLPIIGGEKVKDYRRWTMPLNSFVILCFGMSAMFSQDVRAKMVFYLCGVSCFVALTYQMNSVISEATMGAENICRGASVIRTAVIITVSTWFPFPIWYALSPEGFNVIPNSAAMKIAVAFLNVLSKGAFIFYVSRVNSNIRVREHAINQFEVVAELEHKKNTLKQLGQAADQTEISVRLAVIIEEVLASMGRGKDFNAMKETLEANIITTTDDIMVLTQNYCESISIPWGFVVACKQKVRASRAQNDDSWTFPNKDEQPVEREFAALPPQVANDPRKLKEHTRRLTGQPNVEAGVSPRPFSFAPEDDDFDRHSAGGESTHTARTAATTARTPSIKVIKQEANGGGLSAENKDSLQAAITASQTMMLDEIRLMRKQQMEQYSRVSGLEDHVNKEIEQIGEKLEGAMSKVMTVIEQRLDQTVPR